MSQSQFIMFRWISRPLLVKKIFEQLWKLSMEIWKKVSKFWREVFKLYLSLNGSPRKACRFQSWISQNISSSDRFDQFCSCCMLFGITTCMEELFVFLVLTQGKFLHQRVGYLVHTITIDILTIYYHPFRRETEREILSFETWRFWRRILTYRNRWQ